MSATSADTKELLNSVSPSTTDRRRVQMLPYQWCKYVSWPCEFLQNGNNRRSLHKLAPVDTSSEHFKIMNDITVGEYHFGSKMLAFWVFSPLNATKMPCGEWAHHDAKCAGLGNMVPISSVSSSVFFFKKKENKYTPTKGLLHCC